MHSSYIRKNNPTGGFQSNIYSMVTAFRIRLSYTFQSSLFTSCINTTVVKGHYSKRQCKESVVNNCTLPITHLVKVNFGKTNFRFAEINFLKIKQISHVCAWHVVSYIFLNKIFWFVLLPGLNCNTCLGKEGQTHTKFVSIPNMGITFTQYKKTLKRWGEQNMYMPSYFPGLRTTYLFWIIQKIILFIIIVKQRHLNK